MKNSGDLIRRIRNVNMKNMAMASLDIHQRTYHKIPQHFDKPAQKSKASYITPQNYKTMQTMH